MSQFNVFKNASSPDQIYFDITTTNFQSTTAPPPTFYYNESRELPFVDKPDDYYLSIMRFTCETGTLPVFIPSVMPPAQNPTYDPNLTIYSVTLQYVDRTDPAKPLYGDFFQCPIYWRPQDQSIPVQAPIPLPEIVAPASSSAADVAAAEATNAAKKAAADAAFANLVASATLAGYYNCYSFSFWTNLVQESINTAFGVLGGMMATGNTPAITNPAVRPPIFGWDSGLERAYFVVDVNGYQEVNTTAEYTYSGDLVNDPNLSFLQQTVNALPFDYVKPFVTTGNKISPLGVGKSLKTYAQVVVTIPPINTATGLAGQIGAGLKGVTNRTGGVTYSGTYNPSTVQPGQKFYSGLAAQNTLGTWVYVSPGTWLAPGLLVPISGAAAIGLGAPVPQVDNVPILGKPVAKSSFYFPPTVTLAAGNAKLEVYFNAPLFQLFNSFPAISNGFNSAHSSFGRNYRILFTNRQGVNQSQYSYGSATYQGLRVDQEYPTIFNLSAITSLVFCSNTLPVQPNLVSTPLILDNNLLVSRPGMNAATANIITDLTANDGNYRPYLVYQPSAQYRYTTLYGNQPLYNLDLSIFYRTKMGQLIPFQLASGSTVTIKLAFIKKSSVTPGLKL